MAEPMHNRGSSEQTVVTPPELIRAVSHRFGPISWDLAADASNSHGTFGYFSVEDDALGRSWQHLGGVLWCNPPFSQLSMWSAKCARAEGPGRVILLLCPFTMANWYQKFVLPNAYQMALAGRVKFVGHKHYFPKDLVVCVYGWAPGFQVWNWRDWVDWPLLPLEGRMVNGGET